MKSQDLVEGVFFDYGEDSTYFFCVTKREDNQCWYDSYYKDGSKNSSHGPWDISMGTITNYRISSRRPIDYIKEKKSKEEEDIEHSVFDIY